MKFLIANVRIVWLYFKLFTFQMFEFRFIEFLFYSFHFIAYHEFVALCLSSHNFIISTIHNYISVCTKHFIFISFTYLK